MHLAVIGRVCAGGDWSGNITRGKLSLWKDILPRVSTVARVGEELVNAEPAPETRLRPRQANLLRVLLSILWTCAMAAEVLGLPFACALFCFVDVRYVRRPSFQASLLRGLLSVLWTCALYGGRVLRLAFRVHSLTCFVDVRYGSRGIRPIFCVSSYLFCGRALWRPRYRNIL